MTWALFTADHRPPTGLAWFRLPAAEYGSLTCRPEWVGEVSMHGMGYGDAEAWPNMSDWNGYQRTVPKGLEWRPFSDMDKAADLKKDEHVFPGITPHPCPCCGTPAAVTGRYQDPGGGARMWTAPFRPNLFLIRCVVCWLRMPESRDFKALLDRWNRRTPFHAPGTTHGCCGFPVGSGHNGTCIAYGQDEGT